MSVTHNREFWSGLLFSTFGCIGLALGRDYERGTAMQMRAGYVPAVLSWLLCGVGLIIVLRGLLARVPSEPVVLPSKARPFFVLAAVIVFALLLERAGLVASTALLTGGAALAGHDGRKRDVALLALTLTAISVVVFVWGLGLPLRLV